MPGEQAKRSVARLAHAYDGGEQVREEEFERLRRAASQRVQSAVKRGILHRPDQCMLCGDAPPRANGKTTLEAHHFTYNSAYRLRVIWLCWRCHKAERDGELELPHPWVLLTVGPGEDVPPVTLLPQKDPQRKAFEETRPGAQDALLTSTLWPETSERRRSSCSGGCARADTDHDQGRSTILGR